MDWMARRDDGVMNASIGWALALWARRLVRLGVDGTGYGNPVRTGRCWIGLTGWRRDSPWTDGSCQYGGFDCLVGKWGDVIDAPRFDCGGKADGIESPTVSRQVEKMHVVRWPGNDQRKSPMNGKAVPVLLGI